MEYYWYLTMILGWIHSLTPGALLTLARLSFVPSYAPVGEGTTATSNQCYNWNRSAKEGSARCHLTSISVPYKTTPSHMVLRTLPR